MRQSASQGTGGAQDEQPATIATLKPSGSSEEERTSARLAHFREANLQTGNRLMLCGSIGARPLSLCHLPRAIERPRYREPLSDREMDFKLELLDVGSGYEPRWANGVALFYPFAFELALV